MAGNKVCFFRLSLRCRPQKEATMHGGKKTRFEVLPSINISRCALFLDIDGTILEIAATPDRVRIPAGLETLLARFQSLLTGAFALVTGRSVASTDALFGHPEWTVAGCHGAEIRKATSIAVTGALPSFIEPLTAELLGAAPEVLVENKGHALSIHYRQSPQAEGVIARVLDNWRDRLAKDGYALLPGKLVVDIKPAAVSKGTAVRSLMADPPFAERVPIFAGDDLTDQEVMAVLPEFGGIGIGVGSTMLGAAFTFSNPAATRRWLESEMERVSRPPHGSAI
jgi:trehalose 6-phosphate phosphatase